MVYILSSDRVKAATRSTTTGRIPLSSDYVIEARLCSDEADDEESAAVTVAEELKGLAVEQISQDEKTPLL